MSKLWIGLWGLLFSLLIAGCTMGREVVITIRGGPIHDADLAPCATAASTTVAQSTALSGALPLTPATPLTGTATLTATMLPTATSALTSTAPVSGTAPLTPTTSPTPTRTITATLTTTPSSGPTKVAAGTAQATPSPRRGGLTNTPAPTPSASSTSAGKATLIPTNTSPASATPAPTNTRTATGTRTPTPSPTPTGPTPTFTPTPAPANTVYVRSHRDFRKDSTLFVVGEVVNNSAGAVFRVRVTGKFYNNNDQVLATQEAVTFMAQTEPDQRNPFKIEVADAANDITRYELSVQWDDVSVVSYQDLAVLSQEVRENNGPEVAGEVKNDFSENLGSVIVAITLYDDAGAVVDAYQSTPQSTQLAPGDVSPYAVPIAPDQPYTNITVQAQGKRAIFF